MKAKRFLFLVMAICLASGVKAQFYDSADDIYFYYSKNPQYRHDVLVLNFDGKSACWWYASVSEVKKNLKENPRYYEDATETEDYSFVKFISSSSTKITYQLYSSTSNHSIWEFSPDRKTLTDYYYADSSRLVHTSYYQRVDKSFFKLGRSRTPSGTMYE